MAIVLYENLLISVLALSLNLDSAGIESVGSASSILGLSDSIMAPASLRSEKLDSL
jgi:hypothetical protein